MDEVPFFEPLTDVAVIVTFPGVTAVTRPFVLTVAIALLPELHVTVLFVALAGMTVAVNCKVAPAVRLTFDGLTETPVTATVAVVTVTVVVAVFAPSAVLTVTVAEPADRAVIRPVEFTATMAGFPDVNVIFLFEAFEGDTTALNCDEEPVTRLTVEGVSVTPVTEMAAAPAKGGARGCLGVPPPPILPGPLLVIA